ncbi:acyltransferase family protein [Henriciella algicola]|uniref:acyltransferase family protein n=1 Tax=Henriciella algicola TaxID=1608422 RepID=UPI0015FA37A4|nr:acyltransferase [Henriciella algicola]
MVVDALRGIAALLVVIYHARADYWVGVSRSWAQNGFSSDPSVWIGYATYPFSYGWFGVQIFFVLSGYCIHRRLAFELAKSRNTQVNWRRFFIRRFLRIYPIYLAALLCTALVDHLYLRQGGVLTVGELSTRSLLASIFTLQGIVAPMFGTNTVFWTLSIEIHLYLFYPLLFAFNRSHGAKLGLGFAFAVSAAYVGAYLVFDLERLFPYAHGGGPIFLPFVFMWAAGAYLADIEAGRSPALSGALWHFTWVSALIGGFLLHMLTDEVVSALPLAVGAAGLVYCGKSLELKLPWISSRLLLPFVSLGVVSYSLYATHRVAFGIINVAGLSGQSAFILKFILAMAFAIIVASLFYVVVEKTSLNLSSKFRAPRLGVGQAKGERF